MEKVLDLPTMGIFILGAGIGAAGSEVLDIPMVGRIKLVVT